MNPNQNGQVTRNIKKEIEHPVTGAKLTREARISYPEVPSDFEKIIDYFGGDAEVAQKALALAVSAKVYSIFNARLKGGKTFTAISKVRAGLKAAGLSDSEVNTIISGNQQLADSVKIEDIVADLSTGDIIALFKSASDDDAEDSEAGE